MTMLAEAKCTYVILPKYKLFYIPLILSGGRPCETTSLKGLVIPKQPPAYTHNSFA